MATEIELAYIAGLLDGEAYIGIKKSPPYPHITGRIHPQYGVMIAVKMTHEPALQFITSIFGGSYYKERRVKGTLSKRLLFSYRVSDRKAATVLRAVLPYLQVKKPNAENALAFRSLQETGRQHRTKVTGERDFIHWTGKIVRIKNMAYSDEYIALCEEFWKEAKRLNHGPAAD